jgi:hypothetical protein
MMMMMINLDVLFAWSISVIPSLYVSQRMKNAITLFTRTA